ncbi:CCA tRNA nucleotidyltransferase [Candidatus Uhrbacteria bacterium]|nr:CCA tRNA nucleotidyltransferase [Candidatus Uhrbacteria bacterium]
MNLKEEMIQICKSHSALFFVEEFLNDFPNAELFLVGGAVRDILLKRRTKKMDFDFVIRLLEKEKIEEWFESRGKLDFVGKTFGVYKFMPVGHSHADNPFVDIALPRTEKSSLESCGGYKEFDVQSDAKLPIKKDLSRRDFTINAMAVDMRTGELHDPFKGIKDIEQRLIRAVGKPSDRFKEDLSRMLRGVRFASELNFEIEEKTARAIQKQITHINYTKEKLSPEPVEGSKFEYIVPRETIGSELAKTFTKNPSNALKHLKSTGVLDMFFETDATLLKPIQSLTENQITLVVTLLLRNLEQKDIAKKLALTGLDSLPRESDLRIEPNDIFWLVAQLQKKYDTHSIATMRASKFEAMFMNTRGKFFVQLLRTLNEHAEANAIENRKSKILKLWSVEDEEPIPSLLSGNDVLNAGIQAGPKIRELLDLLRDEQLDGKILTREKAKEWLTHQS